MMQQQEPSSCVSVCTLTQSILPLDELFISRWMSLGKIVGIFGHSLICCNSCFIWKLGLDVINGLGVIVAI